MKSIVFVCADDGWVAAYNTYGLNMGTTPTATFLAPERVRGGVLPAAAFMAYAPGCWTGVNSRGEVTERLLLEA